MEIGIFALKSSSHLYNFIAFYAIIFCWCSKKSIKNQRTKSREKAIKSQKMTWIFSIVASFYLLYIIKVVKRSIISSSFPTLVFFKHSIKEVLLCILYLRRSLRLRCLRNWSQWSLITLSLVFGVSFRLFTLKNGVKAFITENYWLSNSLKRRSIRFRLIARSGCSFSQSID